MIDKHVVDGCISFPDDDRIYNGRLDLENLIIEFPSNPNGRFDTSSLEIIYFKSSWKKYTAVQCNFIRLEDNKTWYNIDELYEGEFLKSSCKKCFENISFSFSNLTYWLKPKVYNTKSSPEIVIEVLPDLDYTYTIKNSFAISILGNAKTRFSGNKVEVERNAYVILKSLTIASRTELYSFFNSFLNFYTLFQKNLPFTKDIYFNGEYQIELIQMPRKYQESIFDVLLFHEQLDNLDILIDKYYEYRNKLDIVVNLWKACMRRLDSEIIFLHLTQSLETFHRSFFEDKIDLVEIEKEFCILFGGNPLIKWSQILRYYHLFKNSVELGIQISFPNDWKDFINTLKYSRNFYTHHDKKGRIWSRFELLHINQVLRIWIRHLILNMIGLKVELSNHAIKKEVFSIEDLDITKNKYSMQFNIDHK